MKLYNKHKDLEIIVSNDLIGELSSYGIKAFPKEYGGLLIGFYSSNFRILNITRTILPMKYSGERHSFERSTRGISQRLKDLYQIEPNQYYVGEWHTHPNGLTDYSSTDLRSMIDIAKCETVGIENPILLILSVGYSAMNSFKFYLYENEKLLAYE